MLSIYPACFFKEKNGYTVVFPDLNLSTCGETLDESIAMAVDCLAGHLSTWFPWMWTLMQKNILKNRLEKHSRFRRGLIRQRWKWTLIFHRYYKRHFFQKCRNEGTL